MSDQQMRDRLLVLLKEKSYEKKKVVLSSGKESDFYVDVRQTALHPEGMILIGKLLFKKLTTSGEKVQAIGGMTSGADPMTVSVAYTSQMEAQPLAAFFVRKEPKKHGMQSWIEGTKNLSQGMPVAIVDDVVTTGGSTIKSIERAVDCGYVVKRVLAVVDRQEGGRESIAAAGYTLESLFVKADFTSAILP